MINLDFEKAGSDKGGDLMNAIELLCQEHTQLEDDLERFLDDFDIYEDEERTEMIYQFSSDLIHHLNREESFIYPRLRNLKGLEEELADANREHENIRALLRILNSGDLDEDAARETLEDLFEFLEHHVLDEEQEIFPMVRQNLSMEELEEMNRNVTERKLFEMNEKQIA